MGEKTAEAGSKPGDNKKAGSGKDGEREVGVLDERDIELLSRYGAGPYTGPIRKLEADILDEMKKVNELIGVKESETGLAPPSQWDLISDKQMMQEEQPLQVARCTKIINPGADDAKYVINVRQIAKFVVDVRSSLWRRENKLLMQ